tara:strand:- start:114 stop:569 length:456 start_codon:yes stop_codon:yes gene_type:complete
MSKIPPDLTDLPVQVQVYVAAQAAELAKLKREFLDLSLSHRSVQIRLETEATSMNAALTAKRTAHARAIQNRDTIIAELRLQLHGHKKYRFGSKSESSAQLALELILEELEIEQACQRRTKTAPNAGEKLASRGMRWRRGIFFLKWGLSRV